MEPGVGETPLRLASRIRETETPDSDVTDTITGLYLNTRYGPPDLVPIEQLKSAVDAYRQRA